jgi:hypothetical protein
MGDRWLIIPGWDKFQHPDVGRTDRTPLWVKNYLALLHKDEYLDLTAHQRAVLHGLWLLYAEKRCQVRVNTASLSRQLNLRVSSRQLQALETAGFVQFLQADGLQAASLEVEVEVEVERFAFTSTTDAGADDGQTTGKPDYEFPINIDDILKEL